MEIFGTLNKYFETGTEGVYWAIEKAPSGIVCGASRDDLYLIDENDFLEIYDPYSLYAYGKHKIIWSGTINKDIESCLMKRPMNPSVEQQNVCGFWVHWLQKDFDNHEKWFWVFALNYPAKIIRN